MKQKIILDKKAIEVAQTFVKSTEPNLIPENIRKYVNILGVVGTYGDEPQPPQPTGLTPFKNNDSVQSVVFNPDLTTTELLNYAHNVQFDQGHYTLLEADVGDESPMPIIQIEANDNDIYSIVMFDSVIFSSDAWGEYIAGYQENITFQVPATWDYATKTVTINLPEGTQMLVTDFDDTKNGFWFGNGATT